MAPPSKMYPIDVDRAFKSLDRIKPHACVVDPAPSRFSPHRWGG